MIISASRRTDIPAFYSEWFLNRLRAGYVLVRNPMNSRQVSRVPLVPETTDCIVFWTKDPLPLLPFLPLLDEMGYRYYFQFTLTPYGRDLEPGLRAKEEIVRTFAKLGQVMGKDRLVWRYDPIILDDAHTVNWHREAFRRLCGQLFEATDECVLSFVDIYRGSRVKTGLAAPGKEQMQETAQSFAGIAKEYEITLSACAEAEDFSAYGIRRARCIDPVRVSRVCGYPVDAKPATGQRGLCRCAGSVDIGAYHTCVNGCTYCYANTSVSRAQKNHASHDPLGEMLAGCLQPGDVVKEREMKSLKKGSGQLRLF